MVVLGTLPSLDQETKQFFFLILVFVSVFLAAYQTFMRFEKSNDCDHTTRSYAFIEVRFSFFSLSKLGTLHPPIPESNLV